MSNLQVCRFAMGTFAITGRRGAGAVGLCLVVVAALVFAFRGAAFGDDALKVEFGENGLKAIVAGGVPVVSDGEPRVSALTLQHLDGSPAEADLTVRSRTFEGRRLRVAYAWGQITYLCAVTDDTVAWDVEVTNTSPSVVRAIGIELLQVRFPEPPPGWEADLPVLTHNIGGPSIVDIALKPSRIAFRNDEIGRPLVFGFPGRASRTERPLLVSSSNAGWLSPFLDRLIDRPIYPGQSDRYRVSLRVGSPQAGSGGPGDDIRRRFAGDYPARLNWTDRRPIGALFISSADLGAPGNPRGWFGDAALTVADPAGVRAFQSRLLDYAARSVEIAKRMNAQGVVLWDAEGQEAPHPTSYLCDPRSLPPEIDGVIDAFFAAFSSAGLATGICIRPQLPVRAAYGGSIDQVEVADVVANLAAKIAYARKRWGTTLFYVDSNGDPNVPIPAEVFRQLAASQPDILLMPEHKNTLYHAYTAPFYSFAHHGETSLPDDVRRTYPGAFGAIYVADGAAAAERKPELAEAVRRGDILVYHGWYDSPNNALVRTIYQEAGRR